MKQRYILFSFAILTLLMLTGCLQTGSSPGGTAPGTAPGTKTGTIMGNVVDAASGLSLWNGQATLAGKTVQIQEGKFEITGIPVGTHTLLVSKAHYQDQTVQVTISGQASMVEVKMRPVYSAAHLDLLARLVHAESRGESYEGQVAVAASILNRVLHRNYPNSLYGVIMQRDTRGYAQYSPIDDGSINLPAAQSAKDAVWDALAGWDPSQGATGFFAPAKVPNRSNWVWKQIPIVQIGNHLFFKSQID
jgi:spore germination cell wall hydrolase CwlJ-like protein